MKYILLVIRNKYLLATVAFGAWLFFYDRNDVPSQISRKAQLDALNNKIRYYKDQIDFTREELENLQSDPGTLEKYAREKYFMKRDNEEVFIIE